MNTASCNVAVACCLLASWVARCQLPAEWADSITSFENACRLACWQALNNATDSISTAGSRQHP